jgi:hypothetical protein
MNNLGHGGGRVRAMAAGGMAFVQGAPGGAKRPEGAALGECHLARNCFAARLA